MDFRERVRERETSKWEGNMEQLLPVHTPIRDWTRYLGTCPDQESNQQPFGVQDDAPTDLSYTSQVKYLFMSRRCMSKSRWWTYPPSPKFLSAPVSSLCAPCPRYSQPRIRFLLIFGSHRSSAIVWLAGYVNITHELDSNWNISPKMSHGVLECDIVTLQMTCLWFCNKRFLCNKKGVLFVPDTVYYVPRILFISFTYFLEFYINVII